MIEFEGFTDRQLDEFRRWQRVAYEVLGEVRVNRLRAKRRRLW
jgi:hypothetical protein